MDPNHARFYYGTLSNVLFVWAVGSYVIALISFLALGSRFSSTTVDSSGNEYSYVFLITTVVYCFLVAVFHHRQQAGLQGIPV